MQFVLVVHALAGQRYLEHSLAQRSHSRSSIRRQREFRLEEGFSDLLKLLPEQFLPFFNEFAVQLEGVGQQLRTAMSSDQVTALCDNLQLGYLVVVREVESTVDLFRDEHQQPAADEVGELMKSRVEFDGVEQLMQLE